MALIEVIKHESSEFDLVYKYPSDELKLGTQVVVGVSQVAFLVLGGKLLDKFESGTHTIKSENIPILNRVLNIPFGGESPFKCEIWFVNLTAKLDLKWGTINPIQLEDQKYGVIIPVRSYGQYGIKISDAKVFLEKLIGSTLPFTPETLHEYFKGKVLTEFTSVLSKRLLDEKSTVLEIPSQISALSTQTSEKLADIFFEYGIQLLNFSIISVNVPEDDPSFKKLKDAQAISAKLKILGTEMYKVDRGLDVLEKAAEKGGSSASAFINAGVGLGAGLGLSGQLNSILSTEKPEPLVNDNPSYYFIMNGMQSGPYNLNQVIGFCKSGVVKAESYLWKPGLASWITASNEPMINSLLNNESIITPPPFNLK